MGRGVGWILDDADRARLLAAYPPRYPHVIAHHVTAWGRAHDAPVPAPASIVLVGHADAGEGIECYVASVDGATARPDGSTYHVTWSLDPASDLSAKHSNDLLATRGWTALAEPVPLATRPDFL